MTLSNRRAYRHDAVKPGWIVTDNEGREYVVHGLHRYVAASGQRRERGVSVRPIEGGRARVIAEHRFPYMEENAERAATANRLTRA